MGLFRIFNVWDTKGLVLHENSADPAGLPIFYSGESPQSQYMALQRNSAGTAGRNPWLIVDPSSYALKLALFRAANSAQLAFQDTWANDLANKVKTAQFVYDSVAVDAALLAEPGEVKCTFEIDVTPTAGGASKMYQAPATLKKGLIVPGLVTTPAGEVTATQGYVKQMCVPRDGTDPNNPCTEFFMLSPSGFLIRVFPDDNGRLAGQRFG